MHNCLQLIDYNWKDCRSSPGKKTDLYLNKPPSNDKLNKVNFHTLSKVFSKSIYIRLLFERQPPAYVSKRNANKKIWVPIGHSEYLLYRDPDTNQVNWSIEPNELVCSPRKLTDICLASIIHDWPCKLPTKDNPISKLCPYLFPKMWLSCQSVDLSDLPGWLLERLLSEAIIQKDCASIAGLISVWPDEILKVQRMIPIEEKPVTSGFLTKPVFLIVYSEENENYVKGPSLLDAFLLGLLCRQKSCRIRTMDFCGFDDDLQLSLELTRLPVLWMSPSQRYSDNVRRHLCNNLGLNVSNPHLESYLTKVSKIYAFHEMDLNHGELFDTVTIHMDCNVSMHEIAIGLCLQFLSPFRFTSNRLTVHRFEQFYLPPHSLIKMFDPLWITRFELEDPELGSNSGIVLKSVLRWLISLRNLRACSLPACITGGENSKVNSENLNVIIRLNKVFLSLRYLQRIALQRCNLGGKLKNLLAAISQPIEYLNLQDCSLTNDDLNFLIKLWRPINGLYELNVSRNDFSKVPPELFLELFKKTCLNSNGKLVCLSIAYTCISNSVFISILKFLAQQEFCSLRVLCLQTFTPPNESDERKILNLAVRLKELRWLYMYPADYAFPGNNRDEQTCNRELRVGASRAYARHRERDDLIIL